MTRVTRETRETVAAVMARPPYWLAGSYLPAYKSGRCSLEALAYAVVAALGRSSYSVDDVDAVLEIMLGMGYGAEPISAVWA